MSKTWHYFVHFTFTTKDRNGQGNIELLQTGGELNSFKEILSFQKVIEEKMCVENAIISNWKLLKVVED